MNSERLESSGQHAQSSVSRRQFLQMGVSTTLGLTGSSLNSPIGEWATYESSDGVMIEFMTDWAVGRDLNTALVYPTESVGLATHGMPKGFIEDLPDLSNYPQTGFVLSILADSGTVADSGFINWKGEAALTERPTEFAGFTRYGAGYIGKDTTFILRLWVGVETTPELLTALARCLKTISIP